ncbi:MAG: hypothetical protein J2P49_01240 [Methylocapsa sp.]|nr:hypothetical protein [Methylocapsa sp.]
MKLIALAALPLLFATQPAFADNGDLSLAALAGAHSPDLTRAQKKLLEKYLESKARAPHPSGKKIIVRAKAVTCRISDVDITYHSCDLDFGTKRVSFEGRKAHELYATLVENDVPSDGAAGSIYEAVTDLVCTIDPDEVKGEGGGGASCNFNPAK